MVVLVKRYNNQRQITKTDTIKAERIRLQPAGLVELYGKEIPGGVQYLRFFATDMLDIFIEDEGK